MHLFKKILSIVVIAIIVLLIVGVNGSYWFVTKSFPQINGTLRVAGLKSKVEIVRDPMGIPHIYADNADDLFFAQGYLHAQDRLWQMEFNRRVGFGTLSAVLGAAAIKQDRYLRTIGLGHAARADMAVMSDELKHILQMYANGVNAFVNTHQDSLPIEFTLLGFKPMPWEPTDTIVLGKVMAMNLSGDYGADLLRSILVEQFGAAKMKELLPPYPASGPFIAPEMKEFKPRTRDSRPETLHYSIGTPNLTEVTSIETSLGVHVPEAGSNNWVIDGTKSTSGMPILANDPHLGIQIPVMWYGNGLHCLPGTNACLYNVAGFTFAGVPGVLIGHNDRIAWGMTNVGPDVQDLFLEKIDAQNPSRYEYQGKWENIQVVEEAIEVKGSVSETMRVQITRHGPIMTSVLPGVTATLALEWTALRDRSRLIESILMIDRARSWDEFRAALKLWDVPSQNFVYADVDGNIGYQMPGNIPIRGRGDGSLPVPGWTGEYDWTGYIPFDELPFIFNPPAHFIATANNAVVPTTFAYLISTDWAAPYRAQRIIDLLQAKEKLSTSDLKEIQSDAYSIPLVQLQKYVAAIFPESSLQQRAMQYIKTWDGQQTTESIGGTIVAVIYQQLPAHMFANKMSKDVFAGYQRACDYQRRVVIALLDQPDSEWWDDPTTPQKETRDNILKTSFAEAVDWLRNQFGDTPDEWRWSRLHTATFVHTLGSVPPLDRLFNVGPIPTRGGVFTLFNASFNVTAPFAVTTVSSMRQIVDLANWDNSLAILSTGQSGQPLHRHYRDMVMMWRDVQYAPFYFDRAAVNQVKEGLLVLRP